MTHYSRNHHSRGATSLFIVLFSTLLFTVITVGFLSLMVSDQRRATDSEWSEGAYDSALAGVEDAKRVLALCQEGDLSACQAIDDQACNTTARANLVAETNGEVVLQSQGTTEDDTVNQAYTCVIVRRDTPDYKGQLEHNSSVLVPLTSNGAAFSKVTISWFTQRDAGGQSVLLDESGTGTLTPPLSALSQWSSAGEGVRPPILRAQLMQYDGSSSVTLNDFNLDDYAHTVFLYPSAAGASEISFEANDRRDPARLSRSSLKSSPVRTRCAQTVSPVSYACTMTLELPDMNSRRALLRLSALYESTAYRVQMKTAENEVVDFYNTQPSVDSTGRAGDVFRRVDARIDMDGVAEAPYPRAAVDVSRSLCKNMRLGAEESAWTCSP